LLSLDFVCFELEIFVEKFVYSWFVYPTLSVGTMNRLPRAAL
jgi:hypothetical protein